MTDLGTLDANFSTHAYDINASRVVVGYSMWSAPPVTVYDAFIWYDGVMSSLDDLIHDPDANWDLHMALGINTDGQIVGDGSHDGGTRAVLLNPGYTLKVTSEPPSPMELGAISVWPDWAYYPIPADPEDNVVVRLTARDIGRKHFKRWKIYDPNYPGQGPNAIKDPNPTISIVMMTDREVTAVYECAQEGDALLGYALTLLLSLCAAVRRAT